MLRLEPSAEEQKQETRGDWAASSRPEDWCGPAWDSGSSLRVGQRVTPGYESGSRLELRFEAQTTATEMGMMGSNTGAARVGAQFYTREFGVPTALGSLMSPRICDSDLIWKWGPDDELKFQ